MGVDSKYGRMFSELEVLAVLRQALGRHYPEHDLRAMIDSMPTKIPRDEPFFLLRGQDASTPDTIMAYADNCAERGASDEHIEAARDASTFINDWQLDNLSRVKVAD